MAAPMLKNSGMLKFFNFCKYGRNFTRSSQSATILGVFNKKLSCIKKPTNNQKICFYSTSPGADYLKSDGRLVYKGIVANNVKYVKIFSLSTSGMIFCMQPYLMWNAAEIGLFPLVMGSLLNTMVLVTPLMLHFLTRKYVTELYYKPETKTFTSYTYTLFLRRNKLKFTQTDVEVPDMPGFFTTLFARGQPLFVDGQQFEDVEIYRHLMGYDKPMNWDFPEEIKKYQEEKNK